MDKRNTIDDNFNVTYLEEDVKQFIRELKEIIREFIKELKEMIKFEVEPLPNSKSISNRLNSQIDKLAGEGLI